MSMVTVTYSVVVHSFLPLSGLFDFFIVPLYNQIGLFENVMKGRAALIFVLFILNLRFYIFDDIQNISIYINIIVIIIVIVIIN